MMNQVRLNSYERHNIHAEQSQAGKIFEEIKLGP